MAILENNGDNDLLQLWGVITELGEQLNQNRSMSVTLGQLAGKIKNQALNCQTGFVLRRFNVDKSKEEYEAEVENMNAVMAGENRSLQHDNKQLNALIKEYEQTLETLMTTFRNRAKDVQERELSLIREYEAKLLAREEENSKKDLHTSTAVSHSLVRLSYLLRQVLRFQNGEDIESPVTRTDDDEYRDWTVSVASDYALERDIELARVEKENEELRRLMGLLPLQRRKDSGSSEYGSAFEAPPPMRLPSIQKISSAGVGKSTQQYEAFKRSAG